MNTLKACVVAGISMLCVTCQETKEDFTKPVSEADVYRTIGEEIPFETGMDWIAAYQKTCSEGRKKLLTPYSITDSQMTALMRSMEQLVGVAFHYGIDEEGTKHIIAIPVDESLRLWESIPGRILVDTNTGAEISQSVALTWAENYREANPSGIWLHFFGANILDNMLALPYFDSVEIEPAINILNLKPQLLLVVYDTGLPNIGRSQDMPGTVYDASNACPPCAVR